MEKTDIKSLNLEELTAFVESIGEKKFRAKQIYEWMHRKHVASFSEMTNISAALIEKLNQNCTLTSLKKADVQISKIDGTRKYLFLLDDGNVIESVLMRYKHGNSVCISSQVGCRMGCRFCASTLDGLVRGLRPSEMLDQIYQIGTDIGERISNVVVMGTGEPLDNYDNLLKFIELLSDEIGLKYDIKEAVDACRYYFEQTGRRITFEYSLVAGVNDTAEDAAELAELVRGINCHINLIPVNPIKERSYRQPDDGAVHAFQKKLERNGLTVTVRREMGRDIDGACGQLRRKHMHKEQEMEHTGQETGGVGQE